MAVLSPLVELWELFDYPCGQRLAPALRAEVERLREMGELRVTDEVAARLEEISPKTIDRLLAREKSRTAFFTSLRSPYFIKIIFIIEENCPDRISHI